MPNLSALSQGATAALSLGNLVLVTPQSVQGYQPQNPVDANGEAPTRPLPPTLLFHYEGEQTVELTSDITDHYVEDNTSRQDQIALPPEIVTTEGFIGELNDVVPQFLKPLKAIADKLTALTAYAPRVTEAAQLAYAQAFFLYQSASSVLDSAVSAWSALAGGVNGGQAVVNDAGLIPATGPQNKQQIMFQQIYGYWRQRTLFTVQTPWAVFENMAIQKVIPVQSAETRQVTSFKLQFKRIRTARTLKTLGAQYQGRAKVQASGLTNLGTSTPVPSISLGEGLTQMGIA